MQRLNEWGRAIARPFRLSDQRPALPAGRKRPGRDGRRHIGFLSPGLYARSPCLADQRGAGQRLDTRQPATERRNLAHRVGFTIRPMSAAGVRRDKAALSSGCKSHPANAPAGSNRSSHGGNELAEAFGMRVTIYGDGASVQAVTRVNAEQALYGTCQDGWAIFCPSSVSLFDLKAVSSSSLRPARGEAVKVGRRANLSAYSTSPGHTLTASSTTARSERRDDDRRGARLRGADHRATTLYSVGP